MKQKVSIVIACYNDLNVVDAVNSAANQTFENKEIIVVNDGSNAETIKAIESVNSHIDILLNQKNQGQSVARNNGIEQASGDYILNLDSDDSFEPEFCSKAIEILDNNNEVKIVTCYARRFTGDRTLDIFKPRGGALESFLFSNSALGSSMFRKTDWETCGGYEEEFPILGFEDWELFLNILKKGGMAYVIPEVLFHYQVREGSTTDRIRSQKQDKFHQIILKHNELYKANFNSLVEHFFKKLNHSDAEKQKILNKPDLKLGNILLKPIRALKSFFR